ncbi:MAG: hypothetical protein EOO70_02620 [Myxococcaceae bacterium]|nr:MAG: hypothetical protein EOO70_02620 [Myxococcaceae bacterium]
MSRTDRHRPMWVQLADPEEHNKAPDWLGRPQLLHKCCGCYMCSRDAFQVPERRQQRLKGRRQLRRYLRGADSWD